MCGRSETVPFRKNDYWWYWGRTYDSSFGVLPRVLRHVLHRPPILRSDSSLYVRSFSLATFPSRPAGDVSRGRVGRTEGSRDSETEERRTGGRQRRKRGKVRIRGPEEELSEKRTKRSKEGEKRRRWKWEKVGEEWGRVRSRGQKRKSRKGEYE